MNGVMTPPRLLAHEAKRRGGVSQAGRYNPLMWGGAGSSRGV